MSDALRPSDEPLSTPAANPENPRPVKSGWRTFLEDLTVSGFGMATSAGVAYASHYMAQNWEFSPYTWMANFVLPVGALFCGFVAAVGYWIGARLFHHRPTRMLALHILVVSLGTFFSIHHLEYRDTRVNGVPLERYMSFTEYMVETTEHMTYRDTNARKEDQGTDLGRWGWGVAALQVAGFSVGGLAVYAFLAAVPYCDRCSKYLSQKKEKRVTWKEIPPMLAAYDALGELMRGGHLQEAIDQHAVMGDNKRFGGKAHLRVQLRKCPTCENRRLTLTATQQRGSNVVTVGNVSFNTEHPLRMG